MTKTKTEKLIKRAASWGNVSTDKYSIEKNGDEETSIHEVKWKGEETKSTLYRALKKFVEEPGSEHVLQRCEDRFLVAYTKGDS